MLFSSVYSIPFHFFFSFLVLCFGFGFGPGMDGGGILERVYIYVCICMYVWMYGWMYQGRWDDPDGWRGGGGGDWMWGMGNGWYIALDGWGGGGGFSSVLVPPWTAGRGIGDDVMDDGEEIWFGVLVHLFDYSLQGKTATLGKKEGVERDLKPI